jgi:post-segregation antitoxin (ccd killing protein)
MSRIQVTVDSDLNKMIQEQAKNMGLSVSSYARYALKEFIRNNKRQKNLLDRALESKSEKLTLAEFHKQLED